MRLPFSFTGRLLAVVLCTLTAGGSSFTAVTHASVPTSSAPPLGSYGGEEMFRGLVFGSGPVVGLFPEIWDPASPALEARRTVPELGELEDRVVARIRTKDPGFFSRFETEIRSGDHLRVREMLAETGRFVSEDPELDDMLNGPGTKYTSVALYLVVVVAVAVMILLVTEGGAAHSQGPYDPSPFKEGLEADVAVDLITNRLGQSRIAAALP